MKRRERAVRIACCVSLANGIWIAQGCGSSGGERPPAAAPSGPPAPAPSEPSGAPTPPGADPVPSAREGVTVSFRLDPRLTTSSYLGERWVSPPTFTLVQEGGDAARLDARAHVARAAGTVDVSATWTAADPKMLVVPAGSAHQVAIEVRRPGRTELTVTCAEGAKVLAVEARRHAGGWRIDVRQ